MQDYEWKCPFHIRDVVEYVNIQPNCDQSQRILCKTCVSERYGGSLQNLKQLQDVLEEIKQRGFQFKSIMKSKDRLSSEINRILCKMNGLFESRPYLSIEIEPSLNLSVLNKLVHNYYCQSQQKDVESIQSEFNQWQEESQKVFEIKDEINSQLRQIQVGLIKSIDNGQIKYSDLDKKSNISNFKQIQLNFEEKNVLIIQDQAIQILGLEDDKLINKNVINGKQNCIITYVIKEVGNSKIIIGYSNGYFDIWEQTSDGKYINSHEYKDHNSYINFLKLCYNNKILITGSNNGINCWQYNDKQFKWIQLWGNNIQNINYLCVNLNDTLLAAVINQKTISIRLYQQKQFIEVFQQSFDEEIIALCFMNDNDLAIFQKGSRKMKICQYKLNALQVYQEISFNYICTNCNVKIQPIFYKDIGLLQLRTDQELIFIKQKNNKQYEKIKIGDNKMKMIMLFNFGQHIIYSQDNPKKYNSQLLIVARIELQ